MLNVFPDLITYNLFAPVLIRVALGLIFIYFGYLKFFRDRELKRMFFEKIGLKPGIFFVLLIGVIEFVAGILLVIGLYTQIAAIVIAFLMLEATLIKLKNRKSLPNDAAFYFILFVSAVSLIFSGAGLFAFDFPL